MPSSSDYNFHNPWPLSSFADQWCQGGDPKTHVPWLSLEGEELELVLCFLLKSFNAQIGMVHKQKRVQRDNRSRAVLSKLKH